MKGHKCADKVQLHALQEVLDIFQPSEDYQDQDMFVDSGTQLFLLVSIAVVPGLPTPRTLCMQGCIQGKHVHLLVDSGSSHTFISRHLASQLQGLLLCQLLSQFRWQMV
jgi:hypothetical protein